MLTDVQTNNPTGPEPGDRLAPALHQLVEDRTLTQEQAQAVLAAVTGAASPDVAARMPPSPRPPLIARLAEIGAYLGAALVMAAGVVVVAQQWVDLTYGARVGIMVGTSVVLLLTAVGVTWFPRGRPWDDIPNGDTFRRLASTLFTFGALAAYGTVMVAMLSDQDRVTDTEAGVATLVGGVLAFVILIGPRLRADTPLSELAMMGASLAATAGVLQLVAIDRMVLIQWIVIGVGVAWVLVATYTRFMTQTLMVTAFGLLIALWASATLAEVTWSQRLALGTLIVLTLAVYLTRPSWPFIATAVIAAVVLTVTWVGEAVGAAMALLAAGVVTLALAGGALALHRQRRGSTETADRTT